MAADLKNTVTEMYNTWLGFPHLQSGPNSIELAIKPNMTFNLTPTAQDFPRFDNWLIWGSRELRWDIFDADYTESDWKYPPVIGEDHCMCNPIPDLLQPCHLLQLITGLRLWSPECVANI